MRVAFAYLLAFTLPTACTAEADRPSILLDSSGPTRVGIEVMKSSAL